MFSPQVMFQGGSNEASDVMMSKCVIIWYFDHIHVDIVSGIVQLFGHNTGSFSKLIKRMPCSEKLTKDLFLDVI